MLSKLHRFALPLALALILCAAPLTGAAKTPAVADSSAISCPAVTLQHWKDSSNEERYSFLLGFVTMLELEKEWQGAKPLPIGKSLNNSWVAGLSGVTLRDMAKAVDDFISANPDKLDTQVVAALGHIFIRPKLTEQQLKEANARYTQLKGK